MPLERTPPRFLSYFARNCSNITWGLDCLKAPLSGISPRSSGADLSSMRLPSQGSKSMRFPDGIVLGPRAAQCHVRKGACDGARRHEGDNAPQRRIPQGGGNKTVRSVVSPAPRRAAPDTRPPSVSEVGTLENQHPSLLSDRQPNQGAARCTLSSRPTAT
jgi:hypothetical protein